MDDENPCIAVKTRSKSSWNRLPQQAWIIASIQKFELRFPRKILVGQIAIPFSESVCVLCRQIPAPFPSPRPPVLPVRADAAKDQQSNQLDSGITCSLKSLATFNAVGPCNQRVDRHKILAFRNLTAVPKKS